MPQRCGYRCGAQEHVHKNIMKMRKKTQQGRTPGRFGQVICAELGQSSTRIFSGQAGGFSPKSYEAFLGGLCMRMSGSGDDDILLLSSTE